MDFRLCREEEYTAVRRLWAQSFGEEEPWTSWYFSQHYRANHTWVGVEDGNILAQAHLLPHRLMLRGAWREAVYFVGVCVEEKLRGTGIGREVMATALAELRRTGIGVSILQPRWPIFYRKLDWDYCYSRQRYSFSMKDARNLLPGVPPTAGWIPDAQMKAPLDAIYGSFVQTRHGYAMRAQKDWENLLSDHRGEGGSVGILSREGIPAGYVLYNTLGPLLRVREMVCPEPWMVDAAWRFMIEQSFGTGVEILEWDDPAGDPGSALYSGSRSEPFLMGRVTDIRSVLGMIEYPPALTAEMDLTVLDSVAPWNQGTFHWSIRQGKGFLHQAPSPAATGLSIDIGTMSQLVFGERAVRELLAAGKDCRFREDDIEFLEQIFPVCRNFISEYF